MNSHSDTEILQTKTSASAGAVARGPVPALAPLAHPRAAVSGEESQAKGPGCFSPSESHSVGDRWFFFIVKLWTFKTC